MSLRLPISTVAVAVMLVGLTAGPASAGSAGAAPDRPGHRPGYQVSELASLGGTASAGAALDSRGVVAGYSNLPGDTVVHASTWQHGRITDLGTLGGENSAVLWPGTNNHTVVGVAETAVSNPDGESWSCAAFFPAAATHHNCIGFVSQHGQMRSLPTLGGNNGFAAGINDRGQIVGWAENGRKDASCTGDQVRQFRAVRWDAVSHRPHELPPLGADPTSAATAINDHGVAVGISGACGVAVGGVSATHAVIWSPRGAPRDLGTIGGTIWNTPTAINNNGVVTGFANIAGGDPGKLYPNAFVWTARTGMRSLGALPGDVLSQGLAINDAGQIVGESCQLHLADCRAFLWDNGRMIDLNTVVPNGTGHLISATAINDAGVITGQSVGAAGTVAFLATPVGCPAGHGRG